MITRRRFATGACTALVASVFIGESNGARAARGFSDGLAGDLAKIEQESGGRLGVAVLDTVTGAWSGHRAGERFPMCSTFKLLAAAAILARVDAGKERLDRRIRFDTGDVVVNSAVTKDRVGGSGMSLAELCEAAMTFSDNTAGNLLLASLGGPAGLTEYARSLGDKATRLDRIEPDLNEATPGDPRDTTTPAAMLSNLRTLLFGDVLSAESKDQLTRWLLGNKTGDTRLRAGLPGNWRVGDKTGSGERGTTNDVGVVWPPGAAPILISIYLTETSATGEQRNATLAAVGRAVASALDR
ncbi:MAG TPA: class A beta-lactamase [Sphingomonas sp.]|nr:class A beta-lactamase [Sphingomonas sp.]